MKLTDFDLEQLSLVGVKVKDQFTVEFEPDVSIPGHPADEVSVVSFSG